MCSKAIDFYALSWGIPRTLACNLIETAQRKSQAASYPERTQRVSKLLLLDVLVPLCVEKRSTHFLIPMVDPAQFQKRGKEWGVWQMPEETFAAFEESKMQEYTKVLTTVSPTFPLTVFAYIDTIMQATIKQEKKKGHAG